MQTHAWYTIKMSQANKGMYLNRGGGEESNENADNTK